jgi:hypothetical protein
MRLGCAMLIGGIAALAFGIKGISDSIKFQKPVAMTLEAFVKQKPQEGWFELSGVTILLPEATFSTRHSKYDFKREVTPDKMSSLSVPLHSDSNPKQSTGVRLKSEDLTIKSTLYEMYVFEKSNPDEKAMDAWVEQNRARIFLQHQKVRGMVAAGFDRDSTGDIVFQHDNEPPPKLKAIGLIVLGVVLLPASLLGFGMRFNATNKD